MNRISTVDSFKSRAAWAAVCCAILCSAVSADALFIGDVGQTLARAQLEQACKQIRRERQDITLSRAYRSTSSGNRAKVDAFVEALDRALLRCLRTSPSPSLVTMKDARRVADANLRSLKLQVGVSAPMRTPGRRPPSAAEALQRKPPANTQLAVWNGSSGEFSRHDAAAFIDAEMKDLNWRFKWSTKETGVTSAHYQVAMFPFVAGCKGWRTPAGLVTKGRVRPMPVSQKQETFNVDYAPFTKLSAPVPAGQPNHIVMRRPGTFARITDRGRQPRRNPLSTKKRPAAWYLENTRDYHVRVIPLDAQGACVGSPSDSVLTRVGPRPPPATGLALGPACGPKAKHPSVRITKYHPFYVGEPHHYIGARERCECVAFQQCDPDRTRACPYKLGQEYYLPPQDKSFLEKLGSAASDVLEFIKGAINWVSKAYDDIKTFAVKLAMKALTWLPLSPCKAIPAACQKMLEAALNYGLAAIGLPPSLPNFDQLVSMGKDYLAKRIAAQIPLMTDAQARSLIDTVASKAKDAFSGGSNGSGLTQMTGLAPDPEPRFAGSPPMLILEVKNGTSVATTAVSLSLSDGVNFSLGSRAPGTLSTPKLYYEDVSLPIPSLKPGEKLTIPVVLEWARPVPPVAQPGGTTLAQIQHQEAKDKRRILTWTTKTASVPVGDCYDGKERKLPAHALDVEYLAP